MSELTVKDAVAKWLSHFAAGQKATSQASMGYMLAPFVAFWPDKQIASFTREDIARFQDHCRRERGMKGRTVTDRLKKIRRLFDFYAQDGLLVNPVQLERLPSLPREIVYKVPFTEQELATLLAVIPSDDRFYWRQACQVAFHTGLRCVDVANLRWQFDGEGKGSAVNFDAEMLTVHPVKRERVGQCLEIPIARELYAVLLETFNRRDQNSASPFVLPAFHALYVGARNRLIEGFRALCDAAGLPDHSFHSFRHGFVTRLLNAGVDPIVICSMTGQTRDQVASYAHVSIGAKINALEAARGAIFKAKPSEERVINL